MRSTFRKTFAKYVTLFVVPVVAFSCLFVYINMRTNEKSATNYLDGVQKQMCGELDILYSALENMALHMSGNDAILNFDALSDVEKIQTLDGYVQNVPANVELMFFSRIGLEVYIQGQR